MEGLTEQQMLEQKLMEERRQQELKLQVAQKQQFLHHQQKVADAYYMATGGQYPPAIIPGMPMMAMAEEYDDLMPDPLQFVTLMAAPPPPPAEPEEPPPQVVVEPIVEAILPPGSFCFETLESSHD